MEYTTALVLVAAAALASVVIITAMATAHILRRRCLRELRFFERRLHAARQENLALRARLAEQRGNPDAEEAK